MGSADWDTIWSRPYGRYNRHHQAIWDAILPYINGNVVDLGCGPCVMYEGKQVSLIGVDWSQEALRAARKHYPCGVYVQADARHTGLPTEQFDTVILSGLLDYFDDWGEILTEARRLRKFGGKIFGTLLNGFNGHSWIHYPHITSNWHLYSE